MQQAVFRSAGSTVVCVPTRTLAEQVLAGLYRTRKSLNARTAIVSGLETDKLQAPPGDAVVVTTPGRLAKVAEQVRPNRLVLQEADLLLTASVVLDVLRAVPSETQRIFLTASLDLWLRDLLEDTAIGAPFQVIGRPGKVQVDLPGVTHSVVLATSLKEKIDAISFASRKAKSVVYPSGKAELLTIQSLNPAGWLFMHGGQRPSERRSTLQQFQTNRQAGVLAISDLLGRGIDFSNVAHVFHMSAPSARDVYLQRLRGVANAGDCNSVIFAHKKKDVFFAQKNLGVKLSEASEKIHVGTALEISRVSELLESLEASSPSQTADLATVSLAKEMFHRAQDKEKLVGSALGLLLQASESDGVSVLSGVANYKAILMMDPKLGHIRSRTEARRAVLNLLRRQDVQLGRIALSKYGFIVDVPSDCVGTLLEKSEGKKTLRAVALNSLPELVENETLHRNQWRQRDKRELEHKIKRSVRWN